MGTYKDATAFELKTHMDTTVLIVNSNDKIQEVLHILLASEGYHILMASNSIQALQMINSNIDLIILDTIMPGISGLKLCEKIRVDYNVPILFLTDSAKESDKTLTLLAGGDDYLANPFSHLELIVRVKALLRRYLVYKGKENEVTDSYIAIDNIRINKNYNQVFKDGSEVNLTEIEYQLLRLMSNHVHQVYSIQFLYESIWNEPFLYSSAGVIMVHIRKLRMKLEYDSQNPKHIITIRRKGYRLD